MKITSANNQIIIRKNIGIISNRIYFFNKNTVYIIKRIFCGTMYLWYTSERIRILYLLFFLCSYLTAS